MTASDKLFFWLFQSHPDRILQLQQDLPADAKGYSFSAPVLKQREYRLDGLFLPPPWRPELPALILEAQMAADAGFLRRLYAESGRLLQQQTTIRRWRVVVICPSRAFNFGDPEPVAEFLRERVHWIELLPALQDPEASPLLKTLALLVQAEEEVTATTVAIRAQVAGTALEAEITAGIAAILVTRFSGRSIPEICAMGGITLEDFTHSVAYREIFGLGRQEGREEGREEGRQEGQNEGWRLGELEIALRLLQRRCGALSAGQQARIRELPLRQLESLAEALLDFQGPEDLNAWLAADR